jgi:hypothetical protein
MMNDAADEFCYLLTPLDHRGRGERMNYGGLEKRACIALTSVGFW